MATISPLRPLSFADRRRYGCRRRFLPWLRGSTGQPSERGLLQDAAAAYAFAVARYKPERIVVWGFSLGSGVAVALAAERPVGKLILEAPYTSITDVAASAFWFAPVRLLMRDEFRSDQRIGQVMVPLLVMHGELDPTIPVAFGERLFAMANEPKRFVRLARAVTTIWTISARVK